MTEKYLRVHFSNGDIYDIPTIEIAKNRAAYYMKEVYPALDPASAEFNAIYEDEMNDIMEKDYELKDWASNDMDWVELEPHARLISSIPIELNDEFCNAEKEIINKEVQNDTAKS